MRSRPRQEEVRSCYIPVISAGLGFHELHGRHEPLCSGLSRCLQFNGTPGRTPLRHGPESFRAVRVRRHSCLIRTLWTDLSRRNKSKVICSPIALRWLGFFSQLHLEQAEKGTNELF